MRCILFFLCWLGAMGAVRAQYFAEEHWHQGFAIVENGDTLRGLLQYDTTAETIQIRTQANVQTFSARKLLAFQFQDDHQNIGRLFYVFPFPKMSSYPTPIFFELLERGAAANLLRRETLIVRTSNPTIGLMTMPTYPVQIRTVESSFYIFYEDGKIKPFNGSRRQLLTLLPKNSSAVNKYMKERRLNPKRAEDLIQIIRFYNQQNP